MRAADGAELRVVDGWFGRLDRFEPLLQICEQPSREPGPHLTDPRQAVGRVRAEQQRAEGVRT
jgi:hypothetical protein